MKNLADGSQVSERSFEFLRTFNITNSWEIIFNLYGVEYVNLLTKHQFTYLFKHAMEIELKTLES